MSAGAKSYGGRRFYFVMRLLFLAMAGFCVFLAVVVPYLGAHIAFAVLAGFCLLFCAECQP